MGISSCFASLGQSMQLQQGLIPFKVILFISHALTFTSIFFCFRSAYTLKVYKRAPKTLINNLVIAILCILLVFATLTGKFILIKIPAGAALIYSLIVHYQLKRKGIAGATSVVAGIWISFLSIVVHSLKIAINDWFNHKDIAHVIIAISLVIICRGVNKIATENQECLYH
jgi:hypothetical protein